MKSTISFVAFLLAGSPIRSLVPSDFKRFVYVLEYILCTVCVCVRESVYRYSRVRITVMVGWFGWLTGVFFFWHHH